MEEQRKQLITWLKDAYAMEKSQVQMLNRFIKDFQDDQDICTVLAQHKTQTEHQCQRLEECLEHFDQKPSSIKAAAGSLMGLTQGLSTATAMDEKVKDMLMIHAGEHFEHASYKGIGEAARQLGEPEVADIADEIAEEEKVAADWSEKQITKVVDEVLAGAK